MMTRTLALVAGLAGAGAASQAPEIMQQYEQRLGGAVEELLTVVEDFDADAASEGLTRDAALEQYETSEEGFFNKRGESMTRTMHRFQALTDHRQALSDSSLVQRPVLFMKYRDSKLLEGTLSDYKPAIPATTEGAIYGGAGFLLGSGLILLLGRLIRMTRRSRSAAA